MPSTRKEFRVFLKYFQECPFNLAPCSEKHFKYGIIAKNDVPCYNYQKLYMFGGKKYAKKELFFKISVYFYFGRINSFFFIIFS